MKIIYHCYGGSHSSVIAAAIHLGYLDKNHLPTIKQLIALPYFDQTNNKDFGSIRFIGFDHFGNEVYVLGKKELGNRYTKILEGVAEIMGHKDQIIAVDTMRCINWSMKLGGFTSRRLGWVPLGRYLLEKSIRTVFFKLVNLVETTTPIIREKSPGDTR